MKKKKLIWKVKLGGQRKQVALFAGVRFCGWENVPKRSQIKSITNKIDQSNLGRKMVVFSLASANTHNARLVWSLCFSTNHSIQCHISVIIAVAAATAAHFHHQTMAMPDVNFNYNYISCIFCCWFRSCSKPKTKHTHTQKPIHENWPFEFHWNGDDVLKRFELSSRFGHNANVGHWKRHLQRQRARGYNTSNGKIWNLT